MRSLRQIAKNNPGLFEQYLNRAGLTIIGKYDPDPLRSDIQSESILHIASSISEDIDDSTIMTAYQQRLCGLAQEYGLAVGLSEGLDQMSGTWPDPIKAMLNGDDEKEEQPPEGGEDAPPGGDMPPAEEPPPAA